MSYLVAGNCQTCGAPIFVFTTSKVSKDEFDKPECFWSCAHGQQNQQRKKNDFKTQLTGKDAINKLVSNFAKDNVKVTEQQSEDIEDLYKDISDLKKDVAALHGRLTDIVSCIEEHKKKKTILND